MVEPTYRSRDSDPLVGHYPGVSSRSAVLIGIVTLCDDSLAGIQNAIEPAIKSSIATDARFTDDPGSLIGMEIPAALGTESRVAANILLHCDGDVHLLLSRVLV
jgi:hypothetical protein